MDDASPVRVKQDKTFLGKEKENVRKEKILYVQKKEFTVFGRRESVGEKNILK